MELPHHELPIPLRPGHKAARDAVDRGSDPVPVGSGGDRRLGARTLRPGPSPTSSLGVTSARFSSQAGSEYEPAGTRGDRRAPGAERVPAAAELIDVPIDGLDLERAEAVERHDD